jgi:hypothetical protein
MGQNVKTGTAVAGVTVNIPICFQFQGYLLFSVHAQADT